MLLDACTSFCESLGTSFGPEVPKWLGILGLFALGWWKARKVQAVAAAGIAVANESASKAKAEARSAHLQLAEIKGSLRPAALSPAASLLDAARARPSMLDPSITDEEVPTLPRPSAVPSFDRETPAERPTSKGGRDG